MENKDLIIIALILALIYLYYQNRKLNVLTNFTGTNANLAEINEVKKVNQIFANFCKQEIGGKDINELRTKLNGRTLTEILEENEDYETTIDGLKRKKGELEAEITLLTNSRKNQIKEKETIITHEEQLENNKLTEKITSLEEENKQLKNEKSRQLGQKLTNSTAQNTTVSQRVNQLETQIHALNRQVSQARKDF
ncbi:13858_t:CDS:2 [Funneliformis geosporum]|nr:13858_t:CDS:2 [Funneliformis geosporum]